MSCLWVLLVCLLASCASQTLVLRPDAQLRLGPLERRAALPPPDPDRRRVIAVALDAPGYLRLEGLAAGGAWLGRSSYARRPNGLALGPDALAVEAQTWYLYIEPGAADTSPVLTYLPPWKTLEESLAGLPPDPADRRHRLAALRADLAPHRRRYPQATADLDAELRRRHAAAEIDAAAQSSTDLVLAAELLAQAAGRADSLAPDSRRPLQAALAKTRIVLAERRLAQALYTEPPPRLLAHCPPPGSATPADELCHILELLHADALLEAATATLMRDGAAAAALADSARALLQRRPAAPGPLVWERVQQTLSQARRGDLLARAVALSHADLAARIRRHTQTAPQLASARNAQQRFADFGRRAVQEAEAEAFIAALSLGREALAQGREAIAAWTDINRRLNAPDIDAQLVVLGNDTTLLAQRMAEWDALVAHGDRVRAWKTTLRRASEHSQPQTALAQYEAVSALIGQLKRIAPPPGFADGGDLLLQQARAEQTRLGLLALEANAADEGQLTDAEAVRRYRLAGDLFGTGAQLPPPVAARLKETRTALLRGIVDRARQRIDRALEKKQWQAAAAQADQIAALAPSYARPLRARIAVQRARHLRDEAQQDLDRAYVADALARYEEAIQTIAPYADEAAAREIADFVRLEIDNLRSQNLALVRLETATLPLERCLGSGQPLPQQLPFTLIIRAGLIALPGSDDALVRAYDIELILPREDYERLTLKPVTADKERQIPTEFTDLLDGRVSLVLRTAAFAEPPRVQLTVSGGHIDLASLGRRWHIHKGVHL